MCIRVLGDTRDEAIGLCDGGGAELWEFMVVNEELEVESGDEEVCSIF